jgi:hypothetical protein
MATKKYAKYFIEYNPKQWPQMSATTGESPIRMISRMDNHISEGSFYYVVHWVIPGIPFSGIGHPPHIHKEPELLFHIGSNPDDPMDLGSEIEMYMGEEMEKYTFNRSTCIYIPPNLVHAPWKPLNTIRPFIMIQVNQAPKKTEKFLLHILPKEIRDKVDTSQLKDEGF